MSAGPVFTLSCVNDDAAYILGKALPVAPAVGQDGQVLKWNNGTNAFVWGSDNNAGGTITALTGDVTASGSGSVASTIAAGAVDSNKIADGTIVNADISATAAIADTKLATIATAGKVSNSATTATSANTASAIVARDASGNFSAGAISATQVNATTLSASGGTTAARPASPANGYIRYNTDLTSYEAYINGSWQVLAAGSSPTVSEDGKTLRWNNTTKQFDWFTAGVSGSGLQSLNGSTVNTQTYATATTGTDFTISTNTGTGVHTFNLPSASGTNRGLLTSADWTTFNNKQNALGVGSINSGLILDGTIATADLANDAVTSAKILDGEIVNADISATAAIADTKLATISTAGKVSNSATTATSANTVSAIVARDASGNFSAGTITATFSGNGSALTNLNGSNISSGTVAYARLPVGVAASTIAAGDDSRFPSSTCTAGNKMRWNGTAWLCEADADAGGDITAVTAGTGLTGGGTTGAVTLNADIGTAAGQLLTNSAFPNCTSGQKLQMSAGPVFTLSCVNDDAAYILGKALPVAPAVGQDGQVLKWNNGTNAFVWGSDNNAGGTITALTGDVTASGSGSVASTIAAGAVDSNKIADGTISNADISATAAIADTKLATIATAGKVSNSATTATSANTTSAIVARDASGNFSAGTISATQLNATTLSASGGTTAARPASPANGYIRYNTDLTSYEAYINGSWQVLAAGLSPTVSEDGKTLRWNNTTKQFDWFTAGVSGSGLQSLNGSTVNTQTYATATTGTDFTISTNTGTGVHTFNLPSASGTNRGLLTSADWTTFNNKQSALTTGTVTSTHISDGTILDADINASAAIARTKLAAGTPSKAVVTDASGFMTESAATSTEVGYLSGVTSAIQTQLNGKQSSLGYTPVNKAGDAMTGALTMNAQNEVRFADSDSSNYVSLRSPATVAANVVWTLPSADGTSGQVLQTNGAGALSWTTVSAGSGDITDVSTTAPLSGGATSGAVSLTLNYDNSTIGLSGSNLIVKASGITANELGTGAVTSLKILDGTIATADIANLAVTDAKINDLGVDKITSGVGRYFSYAPNGTACTTGQSLSWNNVSTRWECVTPTVGTITALTGDVTASGSGSVAATIAAGAVNSSKIADGTIVDGDISATAAIVDTKLATIATAGKVSNSATTATSANTASAIVARDASGNFSAGTITATAANLSSNGLTVGTNQLVVSGTNVGIGTTTPSEKLQVNGGRLLVTGSSYVTNPTGAIFGQYDATTGYVQAPAGGKFQIWDDATYAIATFADSGNVGIGSTTPSAKLDVNGTTKLLAVNQGATSTERFYPNVISSAANATVTGAWIVHSPIARTTNNMFKIRVHGYGYAASSAIDFTVVGYAYPGTLGNVDGVGGAVINYSLADNGNDGLSKSVGIDANGKVAIALGTTALSAYYYRISVDAWSTLDTADYSTGWSIDQSVTANFGWKDIHALTNSSPLYVSKAGDTMTGALRANANVLMTNTSPTTYYVDSDHRSAMIHVNSNQFYVLSGAGVGSESWATNGSNWPLQIDLTTDAATLGGDVSIPEGALTVSGNANVAGNYTSGGNTVIDSGGGWHRSYNSTGWYNGTYGGGMYMQDSTYVRVYNAKGFYVATPSSAVPGITSYGGTNSYGVHGQPSTAGYGGIIGYSQDGTKYGILGHANYYSFVGQGVLANTGDVSVVGNITASVNMYAVDYYYTSDRRFKKDIHTLGNALDLVSALRGVEFKWKKNGERDIGFIAQEVEQVVPDLVGEKEDQQLGSYKTVKYGNITALLVEAVKSLKKMFFEHDEKINELEAKIQRLEKVVDQLEKQKTNESKACN